MYLGAIYRKSGAIKKGICTYKFPSKQKEHKAPNFYKKHTDTKVCLLDLKSLVLFIDRMVSNCLYEVKCHYSTSNDKSLQIFHKIFFFSNNPVTLLFTPFQ